LGEIENIKNWSVKKKVSQIIKSCGLNKMSMFRRYLSKIKQITVYAYYRYLKKKKTFTEPLKLHLGCGTVYMKDYVNIDVSSDSVADIVSDFRDIYKLYPADTVSEILSVHSISYLRLWEALDFFKECFQLLKMGGHLVLEFPDVEKCASLLIESKNDYANYIEAVRGIYAFDLGQIQRKESFYTYCFGWSAWHIQEELKKIGFKNIICTEGMLHNYEWRDTRVEATK